MAGSCTIERRPGRSPSSSSPAPPHWRVRRYWQGTHQRKVSPFYTAPVSRGEVTQTVTATGTIKPLLDILVSSQISGYVNKVYADFNDKVKAGQLLCTLLPDAYQSAVNSAEGDLENAEANCTELQKVTSSIGDRDLSNQKLLSQSDYDTQAALLGEAAAVVKIKQAALATAKTNLAYCRITAPIDGIVITRNVDQGQFLVAVSLSAPTLFQGSAATTSRRCRSTPPVAVGRHRQRRRTRPVP